ncbi:MAG: hypothetical protein PHR68_04775 [Candidatus Gracilibacteria bacterium]|nr:hypothetical protein [Candidatus Gracilibacteria bacterium]
MGQFYFVLDKISICIVFLLRNLYTFVKFILYKFYCFAKQDSKLIFAKYRDIIMEILFTLTLVSYCVFLGFIGVGMLYIIGVLNPLISISYALLISYSISSTFAALIFYIRYKECENENDKL